jgi:fructan beta-fructosidase
MKMKFMNPIIPVLILALFSLISCKRNQPVGIIAEEEYYNEKFRPQYHFSPKTGWMNDPNGLVYLDGEYHLFYQFYPDSTVWGPMHWGHTVSRDLVHWEHMPVALYPDSLGYIFSGSAVVDSRNTAGFGIDSVKTIVAIFTYHDPERAKEGNERVESQGIAYSNDRGRTWTKYEGNPVLPNPGKRDFRDPKVFRYEPAGKWIMILAVHDRVHLYSSPDLLNWSFESEFGENAGSHGGVWECPDLFPLRDDSSKITKWVMLVSINPGGPNGGSATQYFTGDFDGHKFIPDNKTIRWIDMGPDNYAGVIWSGIPETDGRRIFIGWMSNWSYATVVPTSVWRSAMTIPRELYLVSDREDYSVASKPAEELKLLQNDDISILFEEKEYDRVTELHTGKVKLQQSLLSLEFDADGSNLDSLGIILENSEGQRLVAGYSKREKNFFIDRRASGDTSFSKLYTGISRAPYEAGSHLRMDFFLDAASAEIFIDGGKLVMTSIFFPSEEYSKLRLFTTGGSIQLRKSGITELKSIWN